MTDRRNDYYSYAPFNVQLSYWGPICRFCIHFPFHDGPGQHWCERAGLTGKFVQRNNRGKKTCYEQIDEGEFLLRMDTQRAIDAKYAQVHSFNYKSVRRKELAEKQRLYVSLHREEVLAKHREHYHKNAEKIKAHKKLYYQENKELIKSKVRSYYKSLTREQLDRINSLNRARYHASKLKAKGLNETIPPAEEIYRN